jgi:hypothetical protein
MRKIFTFFIVLLIAVSVNAQVKYETLFNFENGMDTLWWNQFANGTGTKADLKVVLNPLQDNVNSSDSVLMMHLYTGAESWVGYYADLDKLYADYDYPIDQIYLSEESHWLSLMVNKPIESSVRIKLELSTTGANPTTITVADTNTVVNEWELCEFDFTPMIGNGWRRLTIFPEGTSKANRTQELDVYVDNIGFQTSENTSIKEFEGSKMKLYPNPVDYRMAVLYPEMTGVKISNINGQEIRTIKFGTSNQKVIEVGDLSAGTYFVTAIASKGNFTMPFIKK